MRRCGRRPGIASSSPSSVKTVSKQRINSGLEANKVGLNEFTERKSEAQGNVEKLVSAMVRAQLEKDPAIDVLDEWTIPYALHDEKLCPGLWPIC